MKAEGLIELADFRKVLRENEALLSRMVGLDIQGLDRWVGPLRESLALWNHFAERTMEVFRNEAGLEHYPWARLTRGMDYPLAHEVGHMLGSERAEVAHISLMVEEALSSSAKRKRKDYRAALKEVIRAYLGYINANIILSNVLQVGFHDWLDFTPFYGAKFLAVGKDTDPIQEQRKQAEKLFTISFPDLAIRDTRSLLRALEDKRVSDLRRLISEAAAGKLQFDEEFARSVLREIFRVELTAKRWRNVLGYATLPVGFIPWIGSLAEKAVGEAAGRAIDHKLQQSHRWFYMLSEIAEDAGAE